MKYIKQIAIIFGICLIAELMEYLIPLPITASIYGLLLMLGALVTKVVPLKKVEDVADFLTENMTILFVPPAVGIMASAEEVRKILIPLFVISAVTTLLIMSVTGWVSQGIMRAGDAGRRRQAKDTQVPEQAGAGRVPEVVGDVKVQSGKEQIGGHK